MRIKFFVLLLVLTTILASAGCIPKRDFSSPAKTDQVVDIPAKISGPSEQPTQVKESTPEIPQKPEPAEQAMPGALESAQAFMDWYIAYLEANQSSDGEITYPFEEGAHKQEDYFTEAYTAKVDEIVAAPILERGIFDPLMHKWGFYKDFVLESVSVDDKAATVAVKYTSSDLPSWAGATLDLINTEAGWKVDDIRPENIASPVGVSILFYDWYLGSFRAGGSPLQDGAYKTSEYLSEALIQSVAEAQEGPDPFTLSWEIPSGISILEEPVIRGDKAIVQVWRYLYSSQSQPLIVHLEKSSGTWVISDVSLEEAHLNPTEVVEAFYTWYLEYTKADSEGNFRNALVDKAYQDSPYLAQSFKAQLDQREQGYDPILCAHDIPTNVTPDGYFVEKLSPPGEAIDASVVARTSFPGHIFTVELARPGGSAEEWKIDGVTCSVSPEGVVKTFYTWYQGCLEGSPNCRTPHASEAYPGTGLVTERFVERVESLRAEFAKSGGGGYDPIMMAQSTYFAFDVEEVFGSSNENGPGKARVFLRNLSMGDQRASQQGLLVTLVVEGASWKIDNVTVYFENTPRGTAEKFYSWYLNLLRSEKDPQVEYGFEPEAFLSEEYLKEVKPALESEWIEGDNPILLAGQLPSKIEIGEVQVEGEKAVVVVERYFEGQDSPSPMAVSMEVIDDWWLITGSEE